MSTQKQIVSVPFQSTDERFVGVATLEIVGRSRLFLGEEIWLPFNSDTDTANQYRRVVRVFHEPDGSTKYLVQLFMLEGDSVTPESVFKRQDGWSLNYTHR